MQGYEPSYRPDYSPWDQGATGYPGDGGVEVKRSRPWLVALVAVVTLFVLIAALGNQKVSDTIEQHTGGGNGFPSFGNSAARSVLVFGWRFTARDNDTAHLWLASLAFIGAALVLTFLFTAVLSRGRGGFGHLLIGVWSSVVVATLLAGYVRALVVDENGIATGDKASQVFFSSFSPNAFTLAAGLGFGLVTALVAATVGATVRATDQVGAARPPQASGLNEDGFPPPGPAYQPPAEQQWAAPVPGPLSNPSPWSADSSTQRTTAFDRPGVRASEESEQQHTAVLPAVDPQPSPPEQASDTSTQAMPRVEEPHDEPEQERSDQDPSGDDRSR